MSFFIRELTHQGTSPNFTVTLGQLKNFVRAAESLNLSDEAEVFTGEQSQGFSRLRSITVRGE